MIFHCCNHRFLPNLIKSSSKMQIVDNKFILHPKSVTVFLHGNHCISIHKYLRLTWQLFQPWYEWLYWCPIFHWEQCQYLKAHWQISKKQCFGKYCSCDKACQFSALQGTPWWSYLENLTIDDKLINKRLQLFIHETCFFLLGFTPCKTEQPLRGVELQEKEVQRD